LGGEKA
jgi:hypothetical protein